MPIKVEIADEQDAHVITYERLLTAVRAILTDSGYTAGEVSIAIVADAEMHEYNRQYLQHDYPTDVLSFVLEAEAEYLVGQLIVSADYAAGEAAKFGWSIDDEVLLYAIHGALHLVGYDDQESELKAEMREQEKFYLARFGLTPRYR